MIKRYSKWFALVAAIVMLFLVLLYNGQKMSQQANRPMPPRQENTVAADVSVVRVRADRYAPDIEAYGAAEPHYQLSLTAEVTGRVVELAGAFESGRLVKAGDLLVQLDDTDYQAALASAEKNLASARLDLLEAEREASQAEAEWQSSGLSASPTPRWCCTSRNWRWPGRPSARRKRRWPLPGATWRAHRFARLLMH